MNRQGKKSWADGLFDDQEIPEIALKILEAAMTLFARKGYSATSVREIVQEASVTNPMLYYYFENKEGVYTRLIEVMTREFEVRLESMFEEGLDIEERVRRCVDVHLDVACSEPEGLRFFLSTMFGPPEGRPAVDLLEIHMPLIQRIEGLFARAIENGELGSAQPGDEVFLVNQLLGLLNQHMMMSMVLSESAIAPGSLEQLLGLTSPDEVRERFVRFFFGGALGR